jgi:hypothetical protein
VNASAHRLQSGSLKIVLLASLGSGSRHTRCMIARERNHAGRSKEARPGHTVGRSTHRRVILQREAMTITAAASCGEALRTGHTQHVHEPAGVVCVSPSTMRGCLVRNGAVNRVNKTLNLKCVISSCMSVTAARQRGDNHGPSVMI